VTRVTDVFALGVVLAEVLTGAISATKSVAAGSAIEDDDRLRTLPEPTYRLIVPCTDRDPARRPQHAFEVLHQFDRAVRVTLPQANDAS
jgi:hypothetical protein